MGKDNEILCDRVINLCDVVKQLMAKSQQALQETESDAESTVSVEDFSDDETQSSDKDVSADAVARKVAQTLQRAAFDGRLRSALEASRQEATKRRLRDVLAEGASSGRLALALEQRGHEATKQRLRDLFVDATCSGRLAAALPQKASTCPARPDPEAIRLSAAQVLLGAANDGRLLTALQTSCQQATVASPSSAASNAAPSIVDDSNEALRLRVRDAMLAGALNGQLFHALQATTRTTGAAMVSPPEAKASSGDLTSVRLLAKEALQQAAADGSLRTTLLEVRMTALRQRVQSALSQGASDGRLEKALKECRRPQRQDHDAEVDQVSLGALKQRVMGTLLRGTRDGRLATVLFGSRTSPAEPEVTIVNPSALAKDTPMRAVRNGRLSMAILKAKARAKGKVSKNNMDLLRESARVTFLAAARDGRLGLAVAAMAVPAQGLELRHRAHQTLLAAAQDGRLATALSAQASLRARATADEELQQLQSSAKVTLLNSARDGRLAVALKESLPGRVRETLLGAARDGRLASALAAGSAPETTEDEELQGLRLSVRDTLLTSLRDGRLAVAVKELGPRQSTPSKALPPAVQPEDSEAESDSDAEFSAEGGEAMRAEMKNLLLSSSRDGRLGCALRSLRVKSINANRGAREVAEGAACASAKDMLLTAAGDGRLQAALEQMRSLRQPAVSANVAESNSEAVNDAEPRASPVATLPSATPAGSAATAVRLAVAAGRSLGEMGDEEVSKPAPAVNAGPEPVQAPPASSPQRPASRTHRRIIGAAERPRPQHQQAPPSSVTKLDLSQVRMGDEEKNSWAPAPAMHRSASASHLTSKKTAVPFGNAEVKLQRSLYEKAPVAPAPTFGHFGAAPPPTSAMAMDLGEDTGFWQRGAARLAPPSQATRLSRSVGASYIIKSSADDVVFQSHSKKANLLPAIPTKRTLAGLPGLVQGLRPPTLPGSRHDIPQWDVSS